MASLFVWQANGAIVCRFHPDAVGLGLRTTVTDRDSDDRPDATDGGPCQGVAMRAVRDRLRRETAGRPSDIRRGRAHCMASGSVNVGGSSTHAAGHSSAVGHYAAHRASVRDTEPRGSASDDLEPDLAELLRVSRAERGLTDHGMAGFVRAGGLDLDTDDGHPWAVVVQVTFGSFAGQMRLLQDWADSMGLYDSAA
jgi:hypothetical protein